MILYPFILTFAFCTLHFAFIRLSASWRIFLFPVGKKLTGKLLRVGRDFARQTWPLRAAKSKAELKAALAKLAKDAKKNFKSGVKIQKAMHFLALFAPWRENILPFLWLLILAKTSTIFCRCYRRKRLSGQVHNAERGTDGPFSIIPARISSLDIVAYRN